VTASPFNSCHNLVSSAASNMHRMVQECWKCVLELLHLHVQSGTSSTRHPRRHSSNRRFVHLARLKSTYPPISTNQKRRQRERERGPPPHLLCVWLAAACQKPKIQRRKLRGILIWLLGCHDACPVPGSVRPICCCYCAFSCKRQRIRMRVYSLSLSNTFFI
jgi:hypothetical protein